MRGYPRRVIFFQLTSFKITVDSHAVVKQNTEVPLYHSPSFPSGSIPQNYGTTSWAGNWHGCHQDRERFCHRDPSCCPFIATPVPSPTSASSSTPGHKSGLHFSNFIISRMFEYFPATANFSSPSGTQWLELPFIIVPQALGSVRFFQSIFYYSGWVISVILFSASLILSSVLFLGLIHWVFISVITFLSSKNFHLVLLHIFRVFAETCYFVAEAFWFFRHFHCVWNCSWNIFIMAALKSAR